MMTLRERFNNIMQFKPVDRLPVFNVEGSTEQAVRMWVKNEDYPIEYDRDAFFKWDYNFFTFNCGDLPPNPPYKVEIVEKDDVTYTRRDQFGFLSKDFIGKTIGPTHNIYVGAPLSTKQEWLDMKKRYDPATCIVRNKLTPEKTAAFNRSTDPVLLGMNFGPARGVKNGYMFGFDKFMELLMDEPEIFDDMFEFWADFIIKYLELYYKDLHIDAFLFKEDGMGYNFSTMVSPTQFKKHWAPNMRKVVDYLERKGTKTFGFYSSGNLKPIFPALIDCGVNMTAPVEVQAGMDVVELNKEFGNSMAYIGNISRQAVMDGKEAIDRELERKLDYMFEKGGFIPSIDDQIFPDMKFKDVKYCIDQMREHVYGKK